MNHYHLRSLAQIYNLCNLTVKANPNTDLKCLNSLLYFIHPMDYSKFVKLNHNRYNRCSVFKNNKLELAILTWLPGQTSGFHKHNNQCVFKVLENTISEEFLCGSKKTFRTGEIGYIAEPSVHNMSNLTAFTHTVTLHIYTV